MGAAQRRGENIETQKRWAAGHNKQKQMPVNAAKLDDENENLHPEHVSLNLGKTLMQARQAKGLTQKELATKICEKPQIITELEQGRALKNPALISKIERALGVKLRGKDAGKPLSGPRKS